MRYLAAIYLMFALPFAAQAEKLTVTREQCGHVVAHTPDASVAYQPGVTADGRSVAPADLGGGFIVKPPDKITIDIDLALRERLGMSDAVGRHIGDSSLGKVVIENGRATFNGKPLATGDQNAIAAACRELRKGS